ncbi:hypothetical protein MBLNU457_5032t1 [Dothideomycetes sp. NU457]
MVGSRSRGPVDPKEELEDPETLIRAANANARKRKAAEEADKPPNEKKAKATPSKKRKKAKASGSKKKDTKGKKAQGNEATDTATDQQQDVPPPPPATPLPPPRLPSATPEPDFGSLFGESPAPTRSQTPEGGKKTSEEGQEASQHSTPPPPYTPVDPRSTYAGKTVLGYSGKHLPGQRRAMAAKQPRQGLLTPAPNTPAQTEASNVEDTSVGSGLTDELERALNDRSTPSANNQGSAAASTSPEQPQGQAANNTLGSNDVVQSTEMAPAQSTSPTSSTASIRTGALLTDEQRDNPRAAFEEGLQRWRQSLRTAEARPGGILALAHGAPGNDDWLLDDQITRAMASVSEAIRARNNVDVAMIGSTALGNLQRYNRTLSSYTAEEQLSLGMNDFYGSRLPWILPINVGRRHWFLAHVRLSPPGVVNVDVYDSMETANGRGATVRRWIRNSGWYADGQPPARDIHVTPQRSVQQAEGYECGRYTVLNAWALMLGMTPTRNRPPPQNAWPIVDEVMNLAMRGHMDAATIEAMLLHLGIATGRTNDAVAFNRTVPLRTVTSLDNMLSAWAQSGVAVSNAQIRRNATRQQGLDPSRATPEQAQQAHEKLVDDIEATLENRSSHDRSTPEVDSDIVQLLSHTLNQPIEKLPASPTARIELFRKIRSKIRAKAQEQHPPPPSRQTSEKPESNSELDDAADEQREEVLMQLINEIDVMSAAATILDKEDPPEGEELLTIISTLTGRPREVLALLRDDDLEDIFDTAASKRRDLLEEYDEWSFSSGSPIEGTPSERSDPSTQVGGLWEPGDPLPPDETLDSNSPLFNRGTANQNGGIDSTKNDDSKDESVENSDSKDESSKNDDGSGDLQDQDDIGFGPLPGSS